MDKSGVSGSYHHKFHTICVPIPISPPPLRTLPPRLVQQFLPPQVPDLNLLHAAATQPPQHARAQHSRRPPPPASPAAAGLLVVFYVNDEVEHQLGALGEAA